MMTYLTVPFFLLSIFWFVNSLFNEFMASLIFYQHFWFMLFSISIIFKMNLYSSILIFCSQLKLPYIQFNSSRASSILGFSEKLVFFLPFCLIGVRYFLVFPLFASLSLLRFPEIYALLSHLLFDYLQKLDDLIFNFFHSFYCHFFFSCLVWFWLSIWLIVVLSARYFFMCFIIYSFSHC